METTEARLREAANSVVVLTDDLARWDEIHRYVINSERDYLAGNLSTAWHRLRAILAAQPKREGLDVERLLDAGNEVAEASGELIHWDVDAMWWELPKGPVAYLEAIAAEYDRLGS